MTPEQKKRMEELAEKQADKVVGITKLAMETFKDKYKFPESLRPLTIIQFQAGYSKALADCAERERIAVEALEYYDYHYNANPMAREALAKLKGEVK